MKAIIDTLNGFFGLVESIINFVINTILDIFYMVQLLSNVVTNLGSYFGWLPSAIVSSLLVIISIVVVYKIIGREG